MRILLVCFFLFAPVVAMAKPYAPLLEIDKISDSLLKMRVRQAKVPPSTEVPVKPFQSASIFSVTEIASSGAGRFQDNRIVHMASTASLEEIKGYYIKELSGWHTKDFKGRVVFLKTGEQYFWGGNNVLEGPRVEILDLQSGALGGSPEVLKVKQTFPEMKSIVKVFYEKSSSPLLAVDIDKVVESCIASEIASKKKLMKGGSEQYLRTVSENSCKKVRSACEKGAESRFCQKYARKYS